MTRAGRRLLAITLLALAVGFVAGLRAATTFGGHHRQMAPPMPANLALYEPPTISPTIPVVEAVPAARAVRGESAVQAGGAQVRQPLTGWATWYATGPSCLCAAAGPALRVGDWRGSTVMVSANGRLMEVTLADACWCIDRHGQPTLLDLSDEAFALLAPLSRGAIEVTVTWP